MPLSPPSACLAPGCPNRAIARGYCDVHRRTTSQRGYGSAHQRERRAALPGAMCERCGSRDNLQRDHVVPSSMGGTRRRWLCEQCHARFGLRRSSRVSLAERATGISGERMLSLRKRAIR